MVFSRAALRARGLNSAAVDRRVAAGHLLVVGADRFALPTGDWLRALDCALRDAGPRSACIAASSAAVHGMDGFVPGNEGFTGLPEIGIDATHHAREGVRRVAGLDAAIVPVAGRRTLSVAATLVDLGRVDSIDLVERAAEWALRHGCVTERQLRHPALTQHRKGGSAVRAAMDRRPPGAPPTESDPETLFVQLMRRAGLPDPERQVALTLAGTRRRLDFAWRRQRVCCEVDSDRWHGLDRVRADQRRQNEISIDGWIVVRVTRSEVRREAAYVVDLVARALEAGDIHLIREWQAWS